MREKYTTPEMEVIEFEVEDIITASDPSLDENETHIISPVSPGV